MSMIQFEDVCYAYDGEPVLRHVDFAIEQGQAVVLCGPNGAGKSTLLRMINGLIYPEIGCYNFEGQQIDEKRMRGHKYSKWFHQRVGFVWQDPAVQLFCGSVEEELAFGPQQMGLPESEIRQGSGRQWSSWGSCGWPAGPRIRFQAARKRRQPLRRFLR